MGWLHALRLSGQQRWVGLTAQQTSAESDLPLSSLHSHHALQIQGELAEAEAEKEAARLRRQLDRAERQAAVPPKLGKQRFEPAPLQVLASDEVTGSLRRLKPAPMLAKDRWG